MSPKSKLMVGRRGVLAIVVVGVVIGVVATRPDEKNQAAAPPARTPAPARCRPRRAQAASAGPAPIVANEPAKTRRARTLPLRLPCPLRRPRHARRAAGCRGSAEPKDDDVKKFWELLTQGSPRIPRLQEVLDDFPKLADRKNAAGNTPLYEAAKAGQGARCRAASRAAAPIARLLSARQQYAAARRGRGRAERPQVIEASAPGNLDARNAEGNTRCMSPSRRPRRHGPAAHRSRRRSESPRQDRPHAVAAGDGARRRGQGPGGGAGAGDAGANCDTPDKRGNAPLHFAATTGDAALIAAMIDKGAKVDRAGAGGRTPLHLAVAAGKAEAVKALLAKRRRSMRSMIRATRRCTSPPTLPETAVAEALLAAGAKVTTATPQKQTALHVAAGAGNAAMVELFMRNGGAEVLTRGKPPSPVDVAEKAGKKEIAQLLRRLEFPAMLQAAIKSVGQPVSPRLLEMLRKEPRLADATGPTAVMRCTVRRIAEMTSSRRS